MKKVSSIFGIKNLPSLEPIHEKLNEFIDTYISDFGLFLEEYHKINKEKGILLKDKITNEDDITTPFVLYLNYINSPFYFHNQFKTIGTNATTDIGVFIKNGKIPFSFVEAKRLPTPNDSNREETEYVCYKAENKQGGIERYKTGKHAGREKLTHSIMVGYVQENNFSHWHNKINSWIDDEIKSSSNQDIVWNNEDKLVQANSFSKPKVTKYNSIHSRITLSKINLTHYWIDLN